MKTLRILGIRGVPAAHGGFETFAEKLSLHLVERGWRVVVYCQVQGGGSISHDTWSGIERVNVPVTGSGAVSTVKFDFLSTMHAARYKEDLCLILGYNTAVFTAALRIKGVTTLMNMDGLEWSRAKWGPLQKAWLWANERAGCLLSHHLVADHPEIARHLETRVAASKITTIAYGGQAVDAADEGVLEKFGLVSGFFATVIARPEPENSLLEIVEGYSLKPRGMPLVVLGNYDRTNTYHREVLDAASGEVIFPGAIYDKSVVEALRFHSAFYVHGHQVGGTNPSLVEALGAGNAVIAHDNRFNRWVASNGALYFKDAGTFSLAVSQLTGSADTAAMLRLESKLRFEDSFTWKRILGQYETLLESMV